MLSSRSVRHAILSFHRAIQSMKNIERQKRFITDAGHEPKTPPTSIAPCGYRRHGGMKVGMNDFRHDKKQTARLDPSGKWTCGRFRLDEEMILSDKTVFSSVSAAAWESVWSLCLLAKAGENVASVNIIETV